MVKERLKVELTYVGQLQKHHRLASKMDIITVKGSWAESQKRSKINAYVGKW